MSSDQGEFGSVLQVRQALREQAGSPWLESTVRDIGGAFRYFRRNRGFFAVAVVILALGIGAATAVFSVAETLLLRPLSYPESDRLVTLRSVDMMSDYPSTAHGPGGARRLANQREVVRGDRRLPLGDRRFDR